MTINEKINSRSYKSAVEKYKGGGGKKFSCGVSDKLKERVLDNGGTNEPVFGKEKDDWTKEQPLHSRGHQK